MKSIFLISVIVSKRKKNRFLADLQLIFKEMKIEEKNYLPYKGHPFKTLMSLKVSFEKEKTLSDTFLGDEKLKTLIKNYKLSFLNIEDSRHIISLIKDKSKGKIARLLKLNNDDRLAYYAKPINKRG